MTKIPAPLVLASAGSRQPNILSILGLPHRVVPAEVDGERNPGENPVSYVDRLAQERAAEVAERKAKTWVVASHSVVVVAGQVLERPRDRREAVSMLLTLQGRTHRVATGLALAVPPQTSDAGLKVLSGVDVARVSLRRFDEATAEDYVATGEAVDRVGAYWVQGKGSALVRKIVGAESGIPGVPVPLLLSLLERAGAGYRFPPTT